MPNLVPQGDPTSHPSLSKNTPPPPVPPRSTHPDYVTPSTVPKQATIVITGTTVGNRDDEAMQTSKLVPSDCLDDGLDALHTSFAGLSVGNNSIPTPAMPSQTQTVQTHNTQSASKAPSSSFAPVPTTPRPKKWYIVTRSKRCSVFMDWWEVSTSSYATLTSVQELCSGPHVWSAQ